MTDNVDGMIDRTWKGMRRLMMLSLAALAVVSLGVVAYVRLFLDDEIETVHDLAVERATHDERVIRTLGLPVRAGRAKGEVMKGVAGEKADLAIPLTGSGGSGVLHAHAFKEDTRWVFSSLVVTTGMRERDTDLLQPDIPPDGAASSTRIAAPSPPPLPKLPPKPEPPDAGVRTPGPKLQGTLTLVTVPECKVYLGGKVVGETPLFNAPLPAGTHLLRLQGPDGKVHLFSARIRAGQNARFRFAIADLPPER